MKKATATHKVSKTVSVDTTQRHVGREKYTEQKGWGGNQDVGGPGLNTTTQTPGWATGEAISICCSFDLAEPKDDRG